MLEILAHANIGRVPQTHQYIVAEVSEDVSVEIIQENLLPQVWDLENTASARAFGDQWLNEARSAILIVPSVIARLDRNAIVNPFHPDAKKLIVKLNKKMREYAKIFEFERAAETRDQIFRLKKNPDIKSIKKGLLDNT